MDKDRKYARDGYNIIKKFIVFIVLLVVIALFVVFYYRSGELGKLYVSIAEKDFILSKNGSSNLVLDEINLKKGIKIKNRSNYVVFADQWILLPKKTKLLKPNRIEGKEYIYLRTKNKNSFKFSKNKVRLLSKTISNYSSYGKLSLTKDLYLAITDNYNSSVGGLVKLDYKVNVTYCKQVLSDVNQFKIMRSPKGKVRYGYLGDVSTGNQIIHANGYIILDENYKVLDEIYINNTKNEHLDMHDALYIDDGNYIIASFYYHNINGKKVTSYRIEEIENGKTKWSFDTAAYPEFIKTMHLTEYDKNPNQSVTANTDYMHFNSFALDPKDNNLLVSFRNQNSIFKLNRKTGKIMWILGGDNDEFGLTENQKFIHQHSISIEKDGSILMYDNGDKKRNSRITEIKLDEKNMKVIDYNSYDLKGVHTNTYGTVEEVNKDKGLYLINYGQGVNPNKHDVEEVNLKTGKVNFWFDFIDRDVRSVNLGD